MPTILKETRDGVCTLTLNRQTARNAINRELLEALRGALMELRHDSEVRVVVLTGAGDQCFCAGIDPEERSAMSVAELQRFISDMGEVFALVAGLSMPVIAAINGLALGPGWELALCADFRIAGQNATLVFNSVRLAMIPGAGGTQRLASLLGPAKAKELIMTARRVRAPDAERLGLVNKVVEDETLTDCCKQWARDLMMAAPLALEQAKFAIDHGSATDLSTGLAIESKAIEALLPTEDRLEALAAFNDKRKADFKGR